MSAPHDRCTVCGKQFRIYDANACEDDGGQAWCITHLPHHHSQASLNMHLADGRNITIDEVKISESAAGWILGPPQVIWDSVVHSSATASTGAFGGGKPTFMIPPVSRRGDIPVLPRWKVQARLISESMRGLTYFPAVGGSSFTAGGGSQLVLVFFCNDIASRPITALIGDRLFAHVDEKTWRERARDFDN